MNSTHPAVAIANDATTAPQSAAPAERPNIVAAASAGEPSTPDDASTCASCGGDKRATTPPDQLVYAIGRIEPRFPRLSTHKEYAQVVARDDGADLTDRELLHAVLAKPDNRYLARQLCWVLTIEGLDTYILHPRDSSDLDLLIESVRPQATSLDVDVVIGYRGPIASPGMCNGLQVPIVMFEQLYSFDRQSLIKAIPRDKAAGKKFDASAQELLERILLIADNAGATEEHRALNYLAVRYHAIYALAAQKHAQNATLVSVDVRQSPLSGHRRIVEAVFAYSNRATDVTEKYSVRVDVTEAFPFLVSKLSPYIDK